jgi:hypothetical protein
VSVAEMTEQPCPECQALLLLDVVGPPLPTALPPSVTEEDDFDLDTAVLTRFLVCPRCGWIAPG